MSAEVKFCGFTNLSDVVTACDLGVDYLGFIIEVPGSKRSITFHDFKKILEELVNANSNLPKIVAVVKDSPIELIFRIINLGVVSAIQFHGNENPEFLGQIYPQIETWKAFSVENNSKKLEDQIFQIMEYKNSAHKFLLDRPKSQKTPFDAISLFLKLKSLGFDLILSGGLNSENLKYYLEKLSPDILDCASSIEISPGIKSVELMKSFLKQIHA